MRLDADAPVLVLSPHLDDAVLSCWSILTANREVLVVNVFTGTPDPGFVTPVDRMAGATDSAERMGERLAEDEKALALAGRERVCLGLLERQYRDGDPTVSELAEALEAAAGAASALYAPAGLSPNPDHLVVRELALELAAEGFPTELYAELPSATRYGWPHWVSGEEPDPFLVPDADWEPRLGALGLTENQLVARAVRFDERRTERKLEAMRAYRTQYSLLSRGPIDRLGNERVARHEAFWTVRLDT